MEHILFSEGGKRLLQYAGNINRIATGYFFTEGPVWFKKQSKLFYTNFADNTIYSIVPGEEPSFSGPTAAEPSGCASIQRIS